MMKKVKEGFEVIEAAKQKRIKASKEKKLAKQKIAKDHLRKFTDIEPGDLVRITKTGSLYFIIGWSRDKMTLKCASSSNNMKVSKWSKRLTVYDFIKTDWREPNLITIYKKSGGCIKLKQKTMTATQAENTIRALLEEKKETKDA